MVVSQEAKSALEMFKICQRLGLIDKVEEFDRYFIWMREVEYYAEIYKEDK